MADKIRERQAQKLLAALLREVKGIRSCPDCIVDLELCHDDKLDKLIARAERFLRNLPN